MLVCDVNETATEQNKHEHIDASIMINRKKGKASKSIAISKNGRDVSDFDRFGGGGVTHFTDVNTTHT